MIIKCCQFRVERFVARMHLRLKLKVAQHLTVVVMMVMVLMMMVRVVRAERRGFEVRRGRWMVVVKLLVIVQPVGAKGNRYEVFFLPVTYG